MTKSKCCGAETYEACEACDKIIPAPSPQADSAEGEIERLTKAWADKELANAQTEDEYVDKLWAMKIYSEALTAGLEIALKLAESRLVIPGCPSKDATAEFMIENLTQLLARRA